MTLKYSSRYLNPNIVFLGILRNNFEFPKIVAVSNKCDSYTLQAFLALVIFRLQYKYNQNLDIQKNVESLNYLVKKICLCDWNLN